MPRAGPILVVEDDDDIRESICEVLEDDGHEVRAAENGRVALDLLRAEDAERPCLIFLDLMMPVMNGWQLVGELEEDPELASLPVVIITAVADSAPTSSALAAPNGANVRAVLRKPVGLGELLAHARLHARNTSD